MTLRIAINGYGRIGSNILRALYERPGCRERIKVVAINCFPDLEAVAHTTRFDSVHGRFPHEVYLKNQHLLIDGDDILLLNARDPADLPWAELKIDLVLECTGAFCDREGSAKHLAAGAKKVLISAPAKDMDATVVYGVNHEILTAKHQLVSNASCTTNCLAPLVKPLHEALGIEHGLMNTVHAYTNDQCLLDAKHKDWRRARAAALSMIPTKTGAATAVGLVIPELAGKLDGFAIRVPCPNVSLVDFTFEAQHATTVKEVNQILSAAAQGPLKGILEVETQPLVSVDYNHYPASSVVDAELTKVAGKLVKVCAWYDNEWGFSNRMLDVAEVMHRVGYSH